MADYLTTDTELTSVANAIRTKGGTSASLVYPAGFVSAIENLPTGGTYQAKTGINPSTSSQTITPDTGYDALSSVQINAMPSGSAAPPATTITANPSISVSSSGLITATASATKSVTPTVSAGYVSSGTAGTITVSGSNTSQLTTQAAQTIHPSTTDQTIASGKYLTGTQTVKGVLLTNLDAENIKKDVVVKVGDSTDDDCVTSVTGTYEGGGGGSGNEDLIITRQADTGEITIENDRITCVGPYAFYSAQYIGSVSFQECISINTQAFYGCSYLLSVNIPKCTSVGSSAFYGCTRMSNLYAPSLDLIYRSAFINCKMANIDLPVCRTIGSNAFVNNPYLTTISFGSLLTGTGKPYFYSSAFYKCYALLSIYLLGSNVAQLGHTNVFSSTPISNYTTYTGGVYGSIYVPASLYSTYIASTNWVTYASRFVSV